MLVCFKILRTYLMDDSKSPTDNIPSKNYFQTNCRSVIIPMLKMRYVTDVFL